MQHQGTPVSHCLSLCREEAALQDLNDEYQAAIALYRQLLSAGVPAQPQPTPFAAGQPIQGAPPPTYQAPNPAYQVGGPPNPAYQAGGAPNPAYQAGGAPNPTYQAGGAPNPAYQVGGAPNPAYQAGGGVPPAYQQVPSYSSAAGGGGDLQQGAWVSTALASISQLNPWSHLGYTCNIQWHSSAGVLYDPLSLSLSQVPGGGMYLQPTSQDL